MELIFSCYWLIAYYLSNSVDCLLLGNFLGQRGVGVHAHTRMRVHRHMRVLVGVEQLRVRNGVLTVCLLE